MSHHPFVTHLVQAPQLWAIPAPLELDDPAWRSAWKHADKLGRRNLARGWVWSVVQQAKLSTRPGVYPFLRRVDIHIDWVRTIQPYLDADFFTPCRGDPNWTQIPELLVPDLPQDHDYLAWLGRFLFGTPEEQARALLTGVDDHSAEVFVEDCGFALQSVAWELAASGETALLQAASVVSFMAGQTGAVPFYTELPLAARLWFALGRYYAYGNDFEDDRLPQLDALCHAVQSQPALVVARVVRRHFQNDLVTGAADLRLHSHSFFCQPTTLSDNATCAYTVLTRWLPECTALIQTAQALDLPIDTVFDQILLAPTYVTETLSLPATLTPSNS